MQNKDEHYYKTELINGKKHWILCYANVHYILKSEHLVITRLWELLAFDLFNNKTTFTKLRINNYNYKHYRIPQLIEQFQLKILGDKYVKLQYNKKP